MATSWFANKNGSGITEMTQDGVILISITNGNPPWYFCLQSRRTSGSPTTGQTWLSANSVSGNVEARWCYGWGNGHDSDPAGTVQHDHNVITVLSRSDRSPTVSLSTPAALGLTRAG